MAAPLPASSSFSHAVYNSKVVPLTDLPETGQIILSTKPRLINLTHQIPYACTLLDRKDSSNPPGTITGSTTTTASSTAASSSIHRRSSCIASHPHALPTQDAASTSSSATAGSYPECGWTMEQRRGHSALYSGVKSLKRDLETIQIGWVGEIADQDGYVVPSKNLTESHKQALQNELWHKERVVPIFMDDSRAAGHYEGYCKTVLWPLFHYILWDEATDGRIEERNWDDYVFVNQQFANAVVKQYQPGDIVWIHDYHLLLVPHMVRQQLPSAAIGVFIHAPFPSSEIFRCLPKRVEILNGLLGANQIGFQTYSYARHFISSCTRVNGYESTPRGVDAMGSTVWVGTFPIGIDAERVERQRKAPEVLPKMDAIRKTYKGKRIIVGRDKLDLVKGVQQKLQAFEKFLNDYPEMQGEVVLIQVTSPPLVESPKLEAKIAELVAHINGTYGSLNFTPVHHYHQHIDRDEYYALLSVADIGLITSVRDGMNTTSLEYIMCQSENHGPLILSEFTGTAGSLGGALMVNPWDYQGVARGIYDALHLSKEDKRARHNQLLNHVLSHTAQIWAKSFIAELTLHACTWDQSTPTPYLDVSIIVDKYHRAKKRLLMFDYDGTLTPIRKTPGAAVPQEHMLKALAALAADPKNIVWVISGRDQKVLEDWLGGVENLGFSAEHGSFMRQPGSKKWINLTETLDMSWKTDVAEIFTYYTERTQGSFIEHKRSSLTWHYRLADPEFGAFQAKECQNHLENAVLSKLPVEILVGKKNLEVRPTIVNKGEIVKRLLSQHTDVEFVMCAGDDKTDEDMFRALAGSNSAHGSILIGASEDASSLLEPYSPNLVAETAAKIAEATLTHSREHSPNTKHSRLSINGGPLAVQDESILKLSVMVSGDDTASSLSATSSSTAAILDSSVESHGSSSQAVGNEHFSVTIGHALKKTLANWHVTSPEELIRVLGILSGTVDI
ncbi:glycosyltransferase family 20-domain-containing protein [Gamsiella multidivaricata]|uniref:glycosyltransferase family 20-domain-containing protein n=1 Tax=Gamsiella multidivaricata TaxID=101098 RepID=UPI00221F5450|nr:glycosyltransferase family 20-domain-containing protein [Gamsiella multidivaricata]KAI7832183.1 glycosyltransferase family 20-domain-containing protein [Gamsiella multidivaricata]